MSEKYYGRRGIYTANGYMPDTRIVRTSRYTPRIVTASRVLFAIAFALATLCIVSIV